MASSGRMNVMLVFARNEKTVVHGKPSDRSADVKTDRVRRGAHQLDDDT
jgi:hypothetical protein